MPSARAIKARSRKYYKSNAESITSHRGIIIKLIPKIKRLPRVIILKRFTVLTLRVQGHPLVGYIVLIQRSKRQPLVSYIVLILRPKRQPLVSYIVLIQRSKRQPLVSYIVLIQRPKRQPLVSYIVLIQRPKRQPLVSYIVLIQRPKRQLLMSYIVLKQSRNLILVFIVVPTLCMQCISNSFSMCIHVTSTHNTIIVFPILPGCLKIPYIQ